MARGERLRRVEDFNYNKQHKKDSGDAKRNDSCWHRPGNIASPVEADKKTQNSANKHNSAGEVNATKLVFPVTVFAGRQFQHHRDSYKSENAKWHLRQECPMEYVRKVVIFTLSRNIRRLSLPSPTNEIGQNSTFSS